MDVKFHLRNTYAKPDPMVAIIPFRDIHCHVARGVYDNSDPEQWFTVTLDKVRCPLHATYRSTKNGHVDECSSQLMAASTPGYVTILQS
jgi:hypothetical protein